MSVLHSDLQPAVRVEPRDFPLKLTLKQRLTFLVWTQTVILIRHAERGAGADPVLTADGQARAALLLQMLQDAGLAAVYVTATLRSQQTGTPVAQAAGVPLTPYDAADAVALVTAIRAAQSAGPVLVVAHSDTVDDIAAALGAPGVAELTDGQFDRMYIITRSWCGTRLLRLRYGNPTP